MRKLTKNQQIVLNLLKCGVSPVEIQKYTNLSKVQIRNSLGSLMMNGYFNLENKVMTCPLIEGQKVEVEAEPVKIVEVEVVEVIEEEYVYCEFFAPELDEECVYCECFKPEPVEIGFFGGEVKVEKPVKVEGGVYSMMSWG